MKTCFLTIVGLIIIPLFSFSQQLNIDTVRVFYLGGQSNMDGYGFIKDLPDSLNRTMNNIWIFHGNSAGDGAINGGIGKWDVLMPGHGVGFKSDGKTNSLSNRFGVELSFSKRLRALYPNDKIAIIKYSRGGTSIDSLAAGQSGSWEPDFRGLKGINQYDHFLKTINNAFSKSDIDGNGIEDILVPSGIVWMQGESDAWFSEEISSRYYSNLTRLMDLIRASLRADDLPIVLGKISDSGNVKGGKVWIYGELVQYAQEKFAKTDSKTSIVRSTGNYKYSDSWHYNSEGYIDLGAKFADELFILIERNRNPVRAMK